MVLQDFMNSVFFIPTLAIFAFVAGIFVFQQWAKNKSDELEEEALEEIVRGEVEDMVEMWGADVKKQLSYSIFPNGMVNKAFCFKHFNYDRSYIDEDSSDKDEEDSAEDEEDYRTVEELFYFKVRPESLVDRYIAKLTDDVFDLQKYTHYVVVQKHFVEDGEVLTISDDWNPSKMANTWLPSGEIGSAFVAEMTYKAMFEGTLQTSKDAIRAINKMNLEMVGNLQELEKMKDLKSGNLKEQLEEYMEGN